MAIELNVDCIVVGQGLAGSTVAMRLMLAGKRVAVIDKPDKNDCTTVAAGLFNPVTGRKNMVKTWLADVLFPELEEFYREAEVQTGARFFFPMALYRPFQNVEEQNEWMARTADPEFADFIDRVSTASTLPMVHDESGGLYLRRCGYVDTIGFLQAVRGMVKHKGIFIDSFIDYGQIELNPAYVRYNDITAASIVFCEGHRVKTNPWFGGVKVQMLKGETLTIKTAWDKQVLLNRSVYMVPTRKAGEYKIGATYNLKDISEGATQEARLDLEEKMNDLLKMPYEVVNQEWGIRPTTADRRPIVGKHPNFERLYIFNGLGTKGVSLAPYFSKVLVQSMENISQPPKAVNVNRFKLLY